MTLLSCVILKSFFTLRQNLINFAINKVVANIVTEAKTILITGDISRINAHTALAALAKIAIRIKYMLILLFPPATFPVSVILYIPTREKSNVFYQNFNIFLVIYFVKSLAFSTLLC